MSGIDYSEFIPKEAFIVKSRSVIDGRVAVFSAPFLDRKDAEAELKSLKKSINYHTLWIDTIRI